MALGGDQLQAALRIVNARRDAEPDEPREKASGEVAQPAAFDAAAQHPNARGENRRALAARGGGVQHAADFPRGDRAIGIDEADPIVPGHAFPPGADGRALPAIFFKAKRFEQTRRLPAQARDRFAQRALLLRARAIVHHEHVAIEVLAIQFAEKFAQERRQPPALAKGGNDEKTAHGGILQSQSGAAPGPFCAACAGRGVMESGTAGQPRAEAGWKPAIRQAGGPRYGATARGVRAAS